MNLFGDNVTIASILIILMEVLVAVLLISPEYARHARMEEQKSAVWLMGEENGRRAEAFAARWFTRHFVETGFVKTIDRMLIPSEDARKRATGLDTFGDGVFAWTRERLDTLPVILYGTYYRMWFVNRLLLLGAGCLVAFFVDGLIKRQRSIVNAKTGNAVFYHGAKRVMVMIILFPLFIAVAPIQVNTALIVCWAAIMPMVVWVGTQNVQEM